MARNKAMTDAVLLAGDEDLRVGVQQAQEYGVRVHLVGIRPARGSQSTFLLQEADTKTEWGTPVLSQFLSRRAARPMSEHVAGASPQQVDSVEKLDFEGLLATLSRRELDAVIANFDAKRGIPAVVDAQLLAMVRGALQRDLLQPEKRSVRELFVAQARKIPAA